MKRKRKKCEEKRGRYDKMKVRERGKNKRTKRKE